jgi:hypothetical protein
VGWRDANLLGRINNLIFIFPFCTAEATIAQAGSAIRKMDCIFFEMAIITVVREEFARQSTSRIRASDFDRSDRRPFP